MTESAPSESLDDRIARLKRELAEAEIRKASDDLGTALCEFQNLQWEFWEFAEEDAPDPTAEEIQTAAGFVRDAWARFETWRTAARTAAAEATERRPYLALAAVAAPAAPVVFQKRPSGSGSTYRSGNGWKWRLQVAGNMKKGRTWPTREEAEAELALAVADPAFVPVRPDYKRLSPTSKKHCSRCGSIGHNARRCQGAGPVVGVATPGDTTPAGKVEPSTKPAAVAEGDDRARRDALVAEGMDMAAKIAASHVRKSSTRYGMADDLNSAALEGLVKAAADFDPSHGVPFLGYAHRRVTGHVLDYLRAQDHMSRDYRAKAKAGEIDPAPAPVSLDCLVADVGFGDRAPDQSAVDSLDEAERGQVVDILESAASKMPARLRTVLRLRYAEDRTLVQIGAELGVTESRVSQLLSESHAAMRAIVAKDTGLAVAADDPSEESISPPARPAPSLLAQFGPSDPGYIHPGRGWGPVGSDGLAVHLLCNGTGKIRIKKETRNCYPCSGTGKRECATKAAAGDERRSA